MSKVKSLCGGPVDVLQCGASIATVFILYWLDIRPYGIISIITLWVLTVGAKSNNEYKWLVGSEFSNKYIGEMKKLRLEHPGKFCTFSCTAFIVVAFLGKIVPGTLLFTLCLSAAFGFFIKNYLPTNIKQVLRHRIVWSNNDSEVEEFLPELNDHNLDLLNRAYGAEFKNDSDVESDKTSDALLLDKIPNLSANSSESDGDAVPIDEIEFKSGYFNGDSSTDDDCYTQGLNFKENSGMDVIDLPRIATDLKVIPDVIETKLDLPHRSVSGWMSYLSDMVTAMSATATESQSPLKSIKNRKRDSDSDSEFEIVNSDDLNNRIYK